MKNLFGIPLKKGRSRWGGTLFLVLSMFVWVFVLGSVPTGAQELDSARVRAEVRIKRQVEIETITRHVAQAVMTDGDSLSAEQLAVVERVALALAKDVDFFQDQQERENVVREERKELITAIVLNVAKGIAIIIALLVLRAIIGAIGRGVAREENKAALLGVTIATRTEEKAREIGKKLVEENLATGGTVMPSIQSIYRRQDGVRAVSEAMVFLKTTYKELPDLIKRVEDLDGENVPEIIAVSRSIIE